MEQNVAKAAKECRAFRGDSGWIEAYLEILVATRSEIALAYPMAGNACPSESQLRRAEEIRYGLPTLKCQSLTESELDALGEALEVPNPTYGLAPDKNAATAQSARASELFPGPAVPQSPQSPLQAPTKDYFEPTVVVPDACLAVYEVPDAIVRALRDKSVLPNLGVKWNAAIIARPLHPTVPEPKLGTKDPRDAVESWQSIAEDVSEFAGNLTTPELHLYVEISYDC